MRHNLNSNEPRDLQRLQRVLHLAILASFLLPFATVSSCPGPQGSSETYTGIELLTEDAGAFLIGVVLLAVLLLALSFRRRALAPIRQGLLSAFEALLCAVATLTTFFATGITFMFSRVSLEIGFYVCTASWILLQLLHMRSALVDFSRVRTQCREPPPPWGLGVGALATVVIVASAWISEPTGIAELLLGVLAGCLVGAPLVVAAMLVSLLYRLRIQRASYAGEPRQTTR